ncbi:DUF7003 family protein [Shouchella miscanthi]|uniref:DUF4304 domain-containing protein n=1 Tax=Shouchella miscanthi TaxID=2598861 RepID=A0ABU6NRI8_9BACI|nr:hypothetical protein [Shouchella miscanthi]MED4129407.1 hypothetical protein [Shouchella miscanthi]
MIRAEEVLEILDREFDEFNRPIFEWRYTNYIGSRCSIIKLSNDGWVILIQSFLLDNKGPFISLDIYSNSLSKSYKSVNVGVKLKDRFGLEINYKHSEVSELLKMDKVSLINKIYKVNQFAPPTNNLKGENKEKVLTSFFRHLFDTTSLSDCLWYKPNELLKEIGLNSKVKTYLEIDEWEYPDYLTDASESKSFQSFANFLETGEVPVDLGEINSGWEQWKEFDIN